MKYRKLPVIVEADQWFPPGDEWYDLSESAERLREALESAATCLEAQSNPTYDDVIGIADDIRHALKERQQEAGNG